MQGTKKAGAYYLGVRVLGPGVNNGLIHSWGGRVAWKGQLANHVENRLLYGSTV